MMARSKTGFTLIELLTVIAVIGILAAILIPVVGQVRTIAHRSFCASNLRQIGIALQMYADEHQGWLPQTAHSGTDVSWLITLAPYLDDVDEVRICPHDPKGDDRRFHDPALTSYVVNEYLFVDRPSDPFGGIAETFRRLEDLEAPSRTKAVFIGADHMEVSAYDEHTHSRNWTNWQAVINNIQPDRFRVGDPAPDRTQGTANYLYADGHVESIHASEIKQQIDAGINIAKPPEARGGG